MLKARRFLLTALIVLLIFVQPLTVLSAPAAEQQTLETQKILLLGTWNFTTGDPVEGSWKEIEIAKGHLSEDLLPPKTTAWYQRTFEVPENFSREPLVLWAGKIDDADMVMINGIEVGRTGLDENGFYEGISYWEKTREYVIPESVIQYGKTNTITIRVYNDGGGGGIYEGDIGIYTIPALRQAKGLPSELASDADQNLILSHVDQQIKAMERFDVEAYRQTLADDFFHDGYTVERAVYELTHWSEIYSSLDISDKLVYTFKDANKFIYTAYRTISGVDEIGNRTIIREGAEERYYQLIDGKVKEVGNQSRFYVERYYSHLFNQEMTFRIYLPEGYQTSGRNYPTVYLLHQYNSSSEQFEVDQLHKKLDAWMASGVIQDMIVVMPDTSGSSWYVNMPGAPWQDLITDELIPIVDKRYRTINHPEYRAISGVSMGGFGAYVIGLQHPELFRSIASHMGALGFKIAGQNPLELIQKYNEKEENPDAKIVYLKQFSLYLDGGTEDRLTAMEGSTHDIHEYLRKNGIDHYYYTGPGEHNRDYYMRMIQNSFVMHHRHFSKGLITGSATANPQALTLADDRSIVTYMMEVDRDSITQFVYSDSASFPLEVKLTLQNAITGETIATQSTVVTDLAKDDSSRFSGEFVVYKTDFNDGNYFTVQVEAKWLGMSFPLGTVSLIKVQPMGDKPEDIQIDLMGNWKFIKEDPNAPIQGEDPNLDDSSWRDVQPGLGWWYDGFGGYEDLGSYLGGAWYRRTFHVPNDFPTENLTLIAGKIDDADEVYINGHLVGATGMVDGEFIESFWAQLREYPLDSSVLNYGGENTIAIRMYNNNGGGGLYSGPIGIYTTESLRKVKGLPYEHPNLSIQDAVLATAQEQNKALERKDFDAFKATISNGYFQNGKDKQNVVSEWKSLLEPYNEIHVQLFSPEVYRSEDKILLTAVRTVTGKTMDGTKVVLFSGEVDQYFAWENGQWKEIGDQNRVYLETYYSPSIGREMSFHIFLPPSYANSTKRYPVVYLLHQFQSDSSAFILDNVHSILDQAMTAGQLEEMIVVMPDSDGMSWWINRKNGLAWEDMVVEDLVPWIDSNYRTIPSADFRGITGVSMGGFGSFSIGFRHPEVFRSVASHMGALGFTIEEINPTQILKSLDTKTLALYSIYLDSGDKDSYLFDLSALDVHRYLLEQNIPHFFEIRDGKHDSAFYTASILKSFQHHANHFIRSAQASDIFFDAETYNMRVGETRQLTVTAVNDDRTFDVTSLVTFETSDPSVVEIDAEGILTAKAKGTATVKASYRDLTAASTVVVRAKGGSSARNSSTNKDDPNSVEIGSDGTIIVEQEAKMDNSTGIAVASVDDEALEDLLNESESWPEGTRKWLLNIGEVTGARGYAVQLPVELLKLTEVQPLKIATPIGEINLFNPEFDFLKVPSNSRVTFTLVSAVDLGLTEDARETVGHRPVIHVLVAVDGEELDLPIHVSIPYHPDPMTELQNSHQLVMVHILESGQMEVITNSWYDHDGHMTFATDGKSGYYAVAYIKKTFDDITEHWARKSIEWLASRGIVGGMAPEEFGPNRNITKADFVLMLVRAFEFSSENDVAFMDVPEDAYYSEAVRISAALGIVGGLDGNRFGPKEYLTREEMMVMLHQAMKVYGKPLQPGSDSTWAGFEDANQVSDFALDSVKALVHAGVIIGYDRRLEPARLATRAEVANVIEKLLHVIMKDQQ